MARFDYARLYGHGLKIPPRLYHYTSQQGLIGILTSRTLWSTRIQYLNDSTEFQYTLDLLKNSIQVRRERIEAKKSLSAIVKAFDLMVKGLETLSAIHIHVACFSENKDALALWRGYSPPGSKGFSLGFAQNQLIEAASRHSCFLAPCIYDPQKQFELVNYLIDDFFAVVNTVREEAEDKRISYDFFQDCVFLACVLKHPSFKEEHEWRIVTQGLTDTHEQIGVRPGAMLPIPYFKFEVVQPKEQIDVAVVVGPTPEMDLSIEAVNTLLTIHGCVGQVERSSVPYREV